jgi:hypothetical protein
MAAIRMMKVVLLLLFIECADLQDRNKSFAQKNFWLFRVELLQNLHQLNKPTQWPS